MHIFLVALLSVLSSATALSYNGADFSSLPIVEAQGVSFSDGGAKKPFETILASHGANIARIRVWTAGNYTQSFALSLAKRAKAAGMAIMADLHFSDTWADPGHQSIPAAWPTDLAGLNTEIYSYTRDLVTAFANQGTPLTFIAVGNEINDGLLWPTGRISVNGFQPASELLHSAVSGVRAASSTVKTLIHIANGWDASGVSFFYDGIFIAGALATSDVDTFGFSFYPFYDVRATLSALTSTMQGFVQKFNKDVMIVETDWPVACPSSVALSETNIPLSTAGQQQWVGDIVNVLSNLPGGHGKGIIYWEPGWVGSAALGSACSDNLLVDSKGKARSSMSIF